MEEWPPVAQVNINFETLWPSWAGSGKEYSQVLKLRGSEHVKGIMLHIK